MEPHTWTHSTPRVRPDGTRIEEGDTFVPTDHEERVWGDRMDPVDSEAAEAFADAMDEAKEVMENVDSDELTDAQRLIDGADYRTLQKVAGNFDDIDASQSTSALRVALHTEADEDDVLDAFAAVNAEAEEDNAEEED